MRFVLIPVLLITTVDPSRADDFADLPEIVCEMASTPLERAHIGCPQAVVAEARPEAGVRFAQPEAAPGD